VLELKRLKDFSHHLDTVSHNLDLKEKKVTDLHSKKALHHKDMIDSVKNKNKQIDHLIDEDRKESKLMQQETDIVEE